jgi:hypothetical protein
MATKYLILIACSLFILLCIGLYYKVKHEYNSDSDDSGSDTSSVNEGFEDEDEDEGFEDEDEDEGFADEIGISYSDSIAEGFVSKKKKRRAKKLAKKAALRGIKFIPGIGQIFTIGKIGRKLFKWGKRARKAKRARAARKKLQAARRKAEEAKRRIESMKDKYDKATEPYNKAKEKYDSINDKYTQGKDYYEKLKNMRKKVEITYPEKFAIASYGLWWKAAELGEVKDRVLNEMPDKQKAYSEALERNLNVIKTSNIIKNPPNEFTGPEKDLWKNFLTPEEKAIYINAHPLGKYKMRMYLQKGKNGIIELRNMKYDTTERI